MHTRVFIATLAAQDACHLQQNRDCHLSRFVLHP